VAAGAGVDPAPQSGPCPAPEATGTFTAVGRTRRADAPGLWSDHRDGLLFSFHLHSFAELARYTAGERTATGDRSWAGLLERWLQECSTPAAPAWHPYPTSGRIIAWCAALSAGGWPADLESRAMASLAAQLRLLRRSVEHDIGGNHVLRNGAALAIGGLSLGDARALGRGLRVLEAELARQILADGGHEERSPSYHRAVLADLDDVARTLEAAGRAAPPWLDSARAAMRGWLTAVALPGGALPLLNDAWEGPPVERAAAPFADLADTGYVVLRHGDDQAVLDVGPVAPPHLPPHAHADVLSFVLWIDGSPVVVDPGTFAYEGPERGAFRGTAAHATVQVDGSDQCDLWGPFRAAHMPATTRLVTERRDGMVVVAAEHDGYARLDDPVRHRRTFCWLPGEGLVVVDRLLSRRPHEAVSRLPLAPGLAPAGDRLGPLEVTPLGAGGPVTVTPARYAPYLGTAVPSHTLARAGAGPPGAAWGWALLRPGATAALQDRVVEVRRRDGSTVSAEVA
jgi:uncharacterized heparinase superfamily protein